MLHYESFHHHYARIRRIILHFATFFDLIWFLVFPVDFEFHYDVNL